MVLAISIERDHESRVERGATVDQQTSSCG